MTQHPQEHEPSAGERFDEASGASGTPLSEQEIQDWFIARIAERLFIEPEEVSVQEPFTTYGLSSREAVVLSGELEDRLGRPLSPTLLYEYPSIETIARYLSAAEEAPAPAPDAAVPHTSNEPIALIGIGCRFPGSTGPEAFWRLLRDGGDAIREVPADRWDLRAYYDPDPDQPGKINTRWGGFLDQVDRFDALFFGISPREAARMDPQQRLMLETAWEALDDAGQITTDLAGSRTGVFVGISSNDYGNLQRSDHRQIDAYAGTGNALSIAANRLSYLFDFRGPSIAVDTACSSSLVAVHLACRSLWAGESTLALAGGVNVILSPDITINFTKAGVMAPDGRCKTFDAGANGYVRSEGAGMVVLKPLSKAQADGDPIYAVILGSAINQDGRTNGLMAPSRQAQEDVLREAYRIAGVSPGQVHYVEAHGTGTFLGDPIEAKALGAVLATDRPAGRPCAVGSVKSNIGHLEAAAGVAGLIKVALALRHRAIPPSLHFHTPNPHIPFDELPLRVQQALGPWPAHGETALAGVSAFGFGGTNAHVVLREAPTPPPREEAASGGTHLLTLSARSEDALRALAQAYVNALRSEDAVPLGDLCYTAAVRRSHHEHRLAVAGHDAEELAEGLAAFVQGEARANVFAGRALSGQRRKLVFVFPGQGSQWFGMARSLMQEEPAFRAALEQCDEALRHYVEWSLIEELGVEDEAAWLGRIDVIQPALFAIDVALAALWRSWGVEPDAVVGHSMGEVAAAYVAGALSLDDAAKVICRRSRLLKRVSGQGSMAVVELSMEDAEAALEGYEDRVSIAASNSRTSTVLSGDPEAIDDLLEALTQQDVFCRPVKVDVASHSPQVDALREELLRQLEDVFPGPPLLPIYSTVATPDDGLLFDAAYWMHNLRKPVLFSSAVARLLDEGHDVFIEISPHPILLGAISQDLHAREQDGLVLPSLRRNEDERGALLKALGALYTLGVDVDWRRLYPSGGRCLRLPAYPWQRERCWVTLAASLPQPVYARRNGNGRPQNPLLGYHVAPAYTAGVHVWQTDLDPRALPYTTDHRVQGAAVLPAATFVEMALAAAAELYGAVPCTLTEIAFEKALFLPEDGVQTVQVNLAPATAGDMAFNIYSQPAGAPTSVAWTLHARGKVRAAQPTSS